MTYYYLDGPEKKGPFSEKEIIDKKLPNETLIIKDGMSKWMEKVFFDELNLSPLVNSDNDSNFKSESEKKIKISSYFFLGLGLVFALLISLTIVYFQRKLDYENFNKSLNDFMDNKSVISDYNFDGTNGQLYKVKIENQFPGSDIVAKIFNKNLGNPKVIKAGNIILSYEPRKNEYSNFTEQLSIWNKYKELKEYYISDGRSGFNAVKLERDGDTFNLKYMWSGDMAYKVPESIHYEGYSNEYYSSPGYNISTYRPPVSKCYMEAAKFLTEEDKDKSYVPGSYNKIWGVDNLESDFYEINKSYPRYYNNFDRDTTFVEFEKDKPHGHVIDNNKATKNTSKYDANVFTRQWIVWYKQYSNNYFVIEKEYTFLKFASIYFSICSIIVVIIFYFFKYKNKIELK